MNMATGATQDSTETSARAYIVIVNWNGWRDTIECIESLAAHVRGDVRVIVVDNGSSDGSIERIRERLSGPSGIGTAFFGNEQGAAALLEDGKEPPLLSVIAAGRNLGFAGGCNVGLRLSLRDRRCSHVWLLNNDTTVEDDALAPLMERCAQDRSIGMCGSTLIYHGSRSMVQAWGGGTFDTTGAKSGHLGFGHAPSDQPVVEDVEKSMAYVIGASMLVTREFIEDVGLMEESYFLYYEELDWAERGKKRYRLGFAPGSVVYHKEGASIGSNHRARPSDLSLSFLYRNRLRFVWRFRRAQFFQAWVGVLWEAGRYCRWGDWSAGSIAFRTLVGLNRPLPPEGPRQVRNHREGTPSRVS